MKYRDTQGRVYRASLERYEHVAGADVGDLVPALPREPGPVHATATLATQRQGERGTPGFLSVASTEPTVCGAGVRVLLPVPFNPEDPDACPECAAGVRHRAPMRLRPGRPRGGRAA